MSIAFSNTTSKNGILQRIEDSLDFNDGDITSNATKLAKFTAKVNSALDEVVSLAIQSSGTWQYDDSNHDDLPFIETDLISGQRDYAFTTDENGNQILDIYRVFVKNPSGIYEEVKLVDQESDSHTEGFWDGQDLTGTPNKYDKTANAIILDPVPNYNWRNGTEGERGLKIFINRESTYFTTSDTTKKAGIVGLFHEYLYLKPAYEYARDKGLSSVTRLERDMMNMQKAITNYYAKREKGVVKKLQPFISNTR